MKSTEAKERIQEAIEKKVSRAVLHDITESTDDLHIPHCAHCQERIKYMATGRAREIGAPIVEVLCNVYVGGRWVRKEEWHEGCYEDAQQPYGEVINMSRHGSQLPDGYPKEPTTSG